MKKNNTKKVWVLTDSRAGNSNQGKALASLLGLDYEEKKLEYSKLASLPNRLKFNFIDLKKDSKQQLREDKPDIVISAGRRMAAVAKSIKKKHPECKLIQIMQPSISLKNVDVLILPEHDKKPKRQFLHKTLFINGAISHYSSEQSKKDQDYWSKKLKAKDYPKPRIAVLVGGQSKGCDFSKENAKNLMNLLIAVAQNHKASLWITTSRRTPSAAVRLMKEQLKKQKKIKYYFYDIDSEDENPYRGYLALSDYIIATGDSVSMCSEACETGKPVYIFSESGMLSPKHQRFINSLYTSNLARPLSPTLEEFECKGKTNSDILKKNIIKLLDAK